MNIMDLLRQRWFYASPNPLTLLSWALMTAYGVIQLKRMNVKFKRFSTIVQVTTSMFTVGLIVLIQDLCWLTLDAIRWIPIFPQFATLDFWLCFPRDAAGLALCVLMTADIYGHFTLNMKTFLSMSFYCIVTIAILIVAPNLQYAIWTNAIEQRAADSVILFGFLTNFLIGKPIIAWCYTTIWNTDEINQHCSLKHLW